MANAVAPVFEGTQRQGSLEPSPRTRASREGFRSGPGKVATATDEAEPSTRHTGSGLEGEECLSQPTGSPHAEPHRHDHGGQGDGADRAQRPGASCARTEGPPLPVDVNRYHGAENLS